MLYTPTRGEQFRMCKWLIFSEDEKSFFIFCFFLFLFIYGGMFLRMGIHYDEMIDSYGEATGTFVAAGRWGLALYRNLTGKGCMPWAYGMISACAISLAVLYQVRLFDITDKTIRCIYAMASIGCIQFLYQLPYSFQADAVAISLLLATIGCAACHYSPQGRMRTVVSSLLFTFAISTYQTVAVYAGVILLACHLVSLEKHGQTAFIKDGLHLFLPLLYGILIWYILSRCSLLLPWVTMGDIHYMNAVQGVTVGWNAILPEVSQGSYYRLFWYIMATPRTLLGLTYPGGWIYATALIPLVGLLYDVWKGEKRSSRIFQAAALIVIWLSPCALTLILGMSHPSTRAELSQPLALAFLWTYFLRHRSITRKWRCALLVFFAFISVKACYYVSHYAWNERLEEEASESLKQYVQQHKRTASPKE